MTIIHWFRRDLRLDDNTALYAAAHASGGMVVPVFVLDATLLDPQGRFTGAARVQFLFDALRDLAHALQQQGSRLVLRRGDPLVVVPALAQQCAADAVYWNRDYSPYAMRRDTAVAAQLQQMGVQAQSFKDAVISEYTELTTKTGSPYTVYTPYARQWRQRLAEQPPTSQPAPQLVLPADHLPATEPLPTLDALGLHTNQRLPAGGAAAGQALLRQFVDPAQPANICTYAEQRDRPDLAGTSRLSPHLRLGTVSVRRCVQAAQRVLASRPPDDSAAAAGVQTWISELAWRDFYVQILAHYPHVLRRAFRPQYDAIAWENDTALFAAWCEGRTGYPIVDAAMRQLNSEGWMHNRARMIVASFLTKDLLIDWRWGERYFMQQLVDGDPAANNGGWQWAAGTGTDAQPYFRIFNPVSQGTKFDPHGAYVRRYVPELAGVPDSFIHEPQRMSVQLQQQVGVQIGRDYPAPVVDHAVQRTRALRIYRVAKDAGSATGKAQAEG